MLILWIIIAAVCAAIAIVGLYGHITTPVEVKEFDPDNFNGMHVRRK